MINAQNLVAPVLNLNGTAYETLFEDYQAAWKAICVAHDALLKISPHPRDFQTDGEQNYRLATTQHQERVRKLALVRSEIENIAMKIVDQYVDQMKMKGKSI